MLQTYSIPFGPSARPFGAPVTVVMVDFAPFGATRVMRRASISTSATEPSGMQTGPSGKRSPSVTMRRSGCSTVTVMAFRSLVWGDDGAARARCEALTAAPARRSVPPMTTPDPVTLSVLDNRFRAIVEEMGEAMLRTAYSQILNSSRDFSIALCDSQARLLAQADHIPVHVGAMPFAVQAVLDAFGDAIHEGDIYLLNDPYHGGSHLPDLTIIVPVFAEGRLLFWSVVRAHHTDIGGGTHGAYNPAATEIFQEGLRLPPILLGQGRRAACRPGAHDRHQHAPAAGGARRPDGDDRRGASGREAFARGGGQARRGADRRRGRRHHGAVRGACAPHHRRLD